MFKIFYQSHYQSNDPRSETELKYFSNRTFDLHLRKSTKVVQ